MSADPVAARSEVAPRVLAGDVLDAVQVLMRDAPAAGADSWPWEERAAAIASLDRVVELAGVYRAGLLSAHKADGRWVRRGDRSFEGYRGRTAQTGWGEARREMELADGLRELPQAARAVEQGDVGLAHAGVLTRLHARASEPVREALAAGGADELLEQARGMDAGSFAKRAQAWAAAHDPTEVERSHARARAARFCRLQDRDGGTRVEAFLDVVAGASLRTALEALTPVPPAGDERTSEQRRADALTALADRVLDRGADKIGAQIRPHLSLLVPADTWAALRGEGDVPTAHGVPASAVAVDGPVDGGSATAGSAGARSAGGASGSAGSAGARPAGGASGGAGSAGAGPTGSEVAGADPVRPGARTDDPHASSPTAGSAVSLSTPGPARPTAMPELDDGGVVPLSEIRRIACDCEMTRVVLGAAGLPLDVGRTERTYSRALRRAVLVRDRHCRWPGCTMRASWCEVHHVQWYSHGGPTSLDNGLTLCSFHHHEVHRRRVQITPHRDGHSFALLDGTVIGDSRRMPYELLTPRLAGDACNSSESELSAPYGPEGEAEHVHQADDPHAPLW